MEKLRIGVIGVGALGQHHARIYNDLPEAELVGICDPDPKTREKAEQYNTTHYTDYKDLIGKTDAVSIAAPTNLHHQIAKIFLKNNTHVLIEKPITSTLEQADELIQLAQNNNLFLTVGHIERYNSAYKAIKKIIKKVKFIEAHRLGPFTPRIKDCGVVLDLMIHDIDILLALTQSEVTEIDGVGINVLTKHEDIANARLRFANGAIANITASRLTPEKQRKIRIFQDDAYISIDYQNQEASIYRKELFSISQKNIDIKKEEPLKSELETFIKRIQTNDTHNRIDIDARNALEIALEILESIKENSEKIK